MIIVCELALCKAAPEPPKLWFGKEKAATEIFVGVTLALRTLFDLGEKKGGERLRMQQTKSLFFFRKP